MEQNLIYSEPQLEVLISTKNQTSLSFLNKMFPYEGYEKFNILIVNQTSNKNILKSEYKNVRIINSFDTGLSKSRNLAIKNAIGDICLVADDDVVYLPGFYDIIKQAFILNQKASIIKFKIETFSGLDYKKYPKVSKWLLSKKDIIGSSSIEIAFKKSDIVNANVWFNTLFGLGSNFKSGEEYIFLKEALSKKLLIYFENIYIVKHSLERSTSNMGSDDFIRAQSAIYYQEYKMLSYLLLIKLIFFLLRKRFIVLAEIRNKISVGINAIKEYKKNSVKL